MTELEKTQLTNAEQYLSDRISHEKVPDVKLIIALGEVAYQLDQIEGIDCE